MKHYKNNQNQVFAYSSDEEMQQYAKEPLTSITDEESFAITNPPPTPEQLEKLARAEAQAYLNSTDWYYARLAETGQAVPEGVVVKRFESRELLQ